jgi:hypothetical protein
MALEVISAVAALSPPFSLLTTALRPAFQKQKRKETEVWLGLAIDN